MFDRQDALKVRQIFAEFCKKCWVEDGYNSKRQVHFGAVVSSDFLRLLLLTPPPGNSVVFIETAKIRTRITGRYQFWKEQNKAEWTLIILGQL